ncbi:MAG: hypothetical protein WC693_03395 [Patescibacteria group bacterium]|jgi:hypothetical protein
MATKPGSNKRVLLIKTIGLVLLVGGLFSMLLVPAEFTSFYAFAEGGNFHYEGFGFGSLMFAFIVLNVMAYFFFALFGIPLGIGNFRFKKWGYNLSIAFLKKLIIIGSITTASILLSFNLLKTIAPYQSLTIIILISFFLIAIPYFLIKFYINEKTKQLFNTTNSDSYFANLSTNKLAIILLNYLWVSVFFLFIFLQGAFPLFGNFIFKAQGTYLLSFAIFAILVLSYLFYHNRRFARFGLAVYYLLLFLTFSITFLRHSTNALFDQMDLPLYEMEKIVPAFAIPAGVNLGIFFGLLILAQLFLILKKDNQ